ncbi:MAG TPA: hypothetical protein VHP14_05885 [Anaerolineales bacterium]|nr:hypothetical protein [Anaerolineales bacterium]
MITKLNLHLLLGQIARNRSEIKLLNTYKGLPISHPANISSVGGSEIQVHSNKYQLACLYHQRETYLQGEELPFILHSQVMSLHLGNEDAILTDVQVAPTSIGNRTQVRVEPNEPLIAIIQFGGSSAEFFALLADISAEGAAVYFETYMFPTRLCQPGNEISMTISLPDNISSKIKKPPTKPLLENQTVKSFLRSEGLRGQDNKVVITTRGKIVSIHPEFQSKRYRVGMKLYFKDLSRTVILQYIAQRQSEIIRDLGVFADELYSRKKSG